MPRQHIKKQRHYFVNKGPSSQGCGFSSMDVRVGLWRKLSAEELMLLNCDVGEDSWESLGLWGDPTNPFWRRSALGFLWREWCWSWNSNTLAIWWKSWLIWKDSAAGKDWRQEEKGMTEDEMAGWHHGLNGCESEWTPGVGDGQGGLACCSPWGCKEWDTTEWLDWTELSFFWRMALLKMPSFSWWSGSLGCILAWFCRESEL